MDVKIVKKRLTAKLTDVALIHNLRSGISERDVIIRDIYGNRIIDHVYRHVVQFTAVYAVFQHNVLSSLLFAFLAAEIIF